MKKGLLLLGSCILFIISLFFLVGILVFVSNLDFEGIIIFGIPLILFGTLFYTTFKKYLYIINFNISDCLLKWKNSKFLRKMDLVLSCIFYIFVLSSIKSLNSLFVISLILMLLFGALYIIKPLLGNKVEISNIKRQWLGVLIHFAIFIMITLLSNYYLELRINWGIDNFDSMLVESFQSGLDKIIFFIFYGIYKLAIRQGIVIIMAISVYLSLIISIKNCFNQEEQKSEKINVLNIIGLVLFVLCFIIHGSVIIKNLWLIFFNILISLTLIANIIINKFVIGKKIISIKSEMLDD